MGRGKVMTMYEYKVVPAPTRAEKARGLKTTADRFAYTLEGLMNAHGAEGWEYLRADTLPVEERTGFTGRATVYQNVLVFRRPVAVAENAPAPASEPSRTEPAVPILSFSRLRFGQAPDPAAAPRIEPEPGGVAPRLGPATGEDKPG